MSSTDTWIFSFCQCLFSEELVLRSLLSRSGECEPWWAAASGSFPVAWLCVAVVVGAGGLLSSWLPFYVLWGLNHGVVSMHHDIKDSN